MSPDASAPEPANSTRRATFSGLADEGASMRRTAGHGGCPSAGPCDEGAKPPRVLFR